MDAETYRKKLSDLKLEFHTKELSLATEFARANNPYKIGDIFTDKIGKIKIEKIQLTYSHFSDNLPSCVYTGLELKKDGTPKKSGDKRTAWQSNDINK